MTTYRAATGHDVALVSLTALDPQPRSRGIQPTRRTHAASGAVYEDGEYVELEFEALGNATQYQSVLTAFGLLSATTANVTVYVRNAVWNWVRKNGVAVRPEIGRDADWDDFFPRQITILVRDLEDPA